MDEIISKALDELRSLVISGDIKFDNEIGLQIELIIILRELLGNNYYIYPERNIRTLDLKGKNFIKKEIDITIIDENKKYAIELKYPRQGQYPEQMFKVCEDIKFLEQLKDNGFLLNYFIMFTELPNFYNNRGGRPIYDKFRKDKVLSGVITKPTGLKDKTIELRGSYNIKWNDFKDDLKFFKMIV